MLDVLVYRFLRLWRVIVLGAALPVSVVWISAMLTGQAPYALTALAVLVPVAHVLRYPTVWSETMVVSLALSIVLAIAPALNWDLSTLGLTWQLTWLTLLFVALFLVLVSPFMLLMTIGPFRPVEARATRVSHLDADALRKEITLSPGHQTSRTTCGEADAEGRFLVSTIVAEPQTCAYEIDQADGAETADDLLRELEFGPASNVGGTEPEAVETQVPADGILRHEYYAMVHSTGPDHHEVFAFTERAPGEETEVVAVRHEFFALPSGGTRVTMSESGGQLSPVDAFGFWLTGYLDDYLMDEIDRAEGRKPRANRAAFSRQFTIDLANLILPLLGGRRVPPPAE